HVPKMFGHGESVVTERWSMIRSLLFAVLCFSIGAPIATAAAQPVESFYKDKRLTMTVASAVGSGYDAYGRMVARHLGRFIPGNPAIVVQNMPGAGGAVAASHLYNIA